MSKPRLVIHGGPMKTGTTAIGAYLSDAKAAGILPPNVIYPTHDLWFPRHRDERQGGRITKHNQLSDYFLADADLPAARKAELVTRQQIDDKIAEIARFASNSDVADPTVVLVSEVLSSWEDGPELLEVFHRHFGDITMVLAVRSPIAAAKSLLVHRIKDWRFDQDNLDLHTFLVESGTSDQFNYERLISRWSALPFVTLKLIPYFEDESDGYAVVDRFMNTVTGETAQRLDSDFGSRRIHPSLPLRSLRRLIALKKLNRRLSAIPGASSLIHHIFNRTLLGDRHKVVLRGFATRSAEHGDWVLSSEERETALKFYRSSYDALRSTVGDAADMGDWARWFAQQGA